MTAPDPRVTTEAPTPIRVAFVEDDPACRDWLISAIGADARLVLAGHAGTVREARALLPACRADVLLVDLELPDGRGSAVIRDAVEHDPGCNAIVLTLFGDDAAVLEAIAAGATGYLTKDATVREVVDAVIEVRSGGAPIEPRIARSLLRRLRDGELLPTIGGPPPQASALSVREAEVLTLISKGFTHGEIGALLGVSQNTVLTYVKRTYRKLGVRSRTEALFEARQTGMI